MMLLLVELAKDVSRAEEMIERHQELKTDSDRQKREKVRNYTESREGIRSSYLIELENLSCSTYVISFPDDAVVTGLGTRLGIYRILKYK